MNKFNIIDEVNKNIKLNKDANAVNEAPYELVEFSGSNIYRCKEAYVTILFFFNSGKIQLNNETLDILDGNLLILKYSKGVSLQLKSEASFGYALYLKAELFDNYLVSQMSDCPIFYDFIRLKSGKMEYLFFDCSLDNPIYSYIYTLLLESSSLHNRDNKLIKCGLILLLSNLHSIHVNHLIISESSMMEDYDIGRFLKYMTNNYASVSLKSMAEHFNFHPAYFSLLFKQLAGGTFSEKLLSIKLEQAKRLLATTNLPIKHIIELIGFSEKSHFYKSFKKSYSITPGEYRKGIKNIKNPH